MRALAFLTLASATIGCGVPMGGDDAGADTAVDVGPRGDVRLDTGPAVPVSTAHCSYDPLVATAHNGTTVTDQPLFAGAAETFLHVPVGVTLGAYANRAEGIPGHVGFIDQRRTEIAGAFAPSVGIETWPRARAVVISSGCTTPIGAMDACQDTIVLLKADLAIGYQGLVDVVERRLGPDFAGHVVIATSHSHSSFANYTAHAGMQVAFGPFRRSVFDHIAADLEHVAREALRTRAPARIGVAHDAAFDLDNHVTRDRRSENDILAGGPRKDHDLFVIRVDTYDPASPTTPAVPLAVMPVFGIHGTIQDGDNVLASTDAPGGIERVLEEHFARPVVVMHLQGAAGDVSPVGLESGTRCPRPSALCHDYMRAESVGWNALDAIVAAYGVAGTNMMAHAPLEMVTRSIERGPDWTRFTVRHGALSYTPWDGFTPADGRVVDGTGLALLSPIDEFNAPYGAALCGGNAVYVNSFLPGDRTLTMWPYGSCNRVEAIQHFLSTVLSIDIGSTAPICDTTRTTVSAFHVGDWYFSVLPGEPVTLAADHMRALITSVPADHHVVIGYAQDNNGYIMTPEDWIRGGYEPTITFWGPLDGEMLLERVADLYPLLATPQRENASMGETHVAVPSPPEDTVIVDPSPNAGMIPSSVPAYLTTHLLPRMPTSVQPLATVPRLTSAFFTWIGADPLMGTPEVTIEMRQADGTFAPLTRHSGRVVSDGDFLLTWTPDPLNHNPTMRMAPRTHYWTVEWQTVPALGQRGFETLATRAGLPLGTYRFVVVGPTYTVHSSTFQVVAGALEVTRTGGTGTMVTLSAAYHNPDGYRMLDSLAGATNPAPIRGGRVDLSITNAAGTSTMTGVAVDMSGHLTIDAGAGATSIRVTDAFGNTGTLML